MTQIQGLERKFHRPETGLVVTDGTAVAGYASVFGRKDSGGDTVLPGAYAASLERLDSEGRRVKMLWQHDPTQPIGVWEEVREDERGLWVRGRILPEVGRGREALALIAAGAIDGLSIGYRTVKAERNGHGGRRLLALELWEVSLVTFPMQVEARVGAKADGSEAENDEGKALRELAVALAAARQLLAAPRRDDQAQDRT